MIDPKTIKTPLTWADALLIADEATGASGDVDLHPIAQALMAVGQASREQARADLLAEQDRTDQAIAAAVTGDDGYVDSPTNRWSMGRCAE